MKKRKKYSSLYWLLRKRKIDNDIRKSKKRHLRRVRIKWSKKLNNKSAIDYVKISLPECSALFGNIDRFSSMINEIIAKSKTLDYSKKGLSLDMNKVRRFDSAGIIILLSLIKFLSNKQIKVKGSVPKSKNALKMLDEADFFSHVISRHKVSKSGKDTIFTVGDKITDQDVLADQIRKVVGHLTGNEDTFPPLYTTLGEIQINSVEHCCKISSDKNWFMSVHYESDRCEIDMVDIGKGIIGTLPLLLKQNVERLLSRQTQAETLLRLYKGDYQSSTREPNRNNGLPDIKQRVEANFIDKIHVITNKAYIELSEESVIDLNVNFPGTFYAIEITKNNIAHELS